MLSALWTETYVEPLEGLIQELEHRAAGRGLKWWVALEDLIERRAQQGRGFCVMDCCVPGIWNGAWR